MAINLGQAPSGDVLVYEYGARLDPDCLDAVTRQIAQARRLYNDLIAAIQAIVSAMQSYIVTQAGPEAAQLLQRIDALNETFDAAKGNDDRDEMRRIAQDRRVIWQTLGGKLAEVRQTHKAELQTKYYARIDVRYGNTKLVIGGDSQSIRCMHFPSITPVSDEAGVTDALGTRRKTVAIAIGGLVYEVGPEAHLQCETDARWVL